VGYFDDNHGDLLKDAPTMDGDVRFPGGAGPMGPQQIQSAPDMPLPPGAHPPGNPNGGIVPPKYGGPLNAGPQSLTSGNQYGPQQLRDLVNQNSLKTKGVPATDEDYNYWVPKIQEGLAKPGSDPASVVNYFNQRMIDPPGQGSNSGPSGGGGAGGGSFDAFHYDPSQNPTPFQSPSQVPGTFQPPNTTAQPFNGTAPLGSPQQFQNPGSYTPGQVTPQQVQAGAVSAPGTITPQQVQGPGALSAQQLSAPGTFAGPTAADLSADPSYKFRFDQGINALDSSAAASGNARSGGHYQDLINYGQNAASQEYQNVYNRAANTYGTNLNANIATTGANNAANANAYGLTNQYQQNAALANQGANLNAQGQNVANQQNAGMFNATQGANASSQNAANALTAGFGNQANNASAFQNNWQNQFNTTQGNNANTLAFQGQQFGQGLAGYQANLAALGQNYGQAANTYGLNLGAQQQGYNQAANTYGMNLGAQQQAWNQQFQPWQAGVNAQLGFGNLALGQNQFGLQSQNQSWNQANTINNQNWLENQYLAQLGYGTG